jgi:hypothetical protein
MKPYEGAFGYSPEELAEDPKKLEEVSAEIKKTMQRIRKSRETKAANSKPATNRK